MEDMFEYIDKAWANQETDRDVVEELTDLRLELENEEAGMSGHLYRKLNNEEPLVPEDFETHTGFVRFELPAQKYQIVKIIRAFLADRGW